MSQRNHDITQLLSDANHQNFKKVKVAIADIDGILRGKYISRDKFISAKESGFGFCNVILGWDCADVCYDNVSYTGWHTGYPDASAKLDLSSYRRIPWDNQTPFFLGSLTESDGSPLGVCPRSLLTKVIERSNSMGFDSLIGMEFEWFNFRESPESIREKNFSSLQPITPGMFGYSLIRQSQNQEYFNDLMDNLLDFDVPLEGLHTETGPGVYEAAIACSDPLEAADRAVLFKTSVKEIAQKHNITPTFMARWCDSLPGSSGHIHQSLLSKGTFENVFFDGKDPNKMSKLFKNYLAGIIKYLPEVLPMFAPTVNSYKRLVEGFWAPINSNWGVDNRTTAMRVIPGSKKSTRLEVRVGGADLNPYLAVAASLGCGLKGIEENLSLDLKPVKGNGYEEKSGEKLENNLLDAAKKMAHSEIANNLFGEPFVSHFTNTRIFEFQRYQRAVTNWELERYFEII